MANRTLTFELPEDFVLDLGSPDELGRLAKEAFIYDLLRQQRIGQSYAAEVLGISRWDLLDEMFARQIPAGLATMEEVEREIAAVERMSRSEGAA
ncbi:MAG: UPF0175 family protein [Chloroflexi bacterium]|nr:UPF0175 family protein [Chloroflexota bacterium]